MKHMKKILAVTGIRSEYFILRPVLFAFSDSKFSENNHHGAEVCKSGLEKIQPHKPCKQKPVFAVNKAKNNRSKNYNAGNQPQPTFNIHFSPPEIFRTIAFHILKNKAPKQTTPATRFQSIQITAFPLIFPSLTFIMTSGRSSNPKVSNRDFIFSFCAISRNSRPSRRVIFAKLIMDRSIQV